ncbi:MAG: hypothetical protein H8E85_01910 [Candidatus Marinimicrobia bacterium]|nr:hypothetical protein [Candidatus Neomarinimicrobiota bacterium]
MRISIVLALIIAFACQAQNKSSKKTENASELAAQPTQAVQSESKPSADELVVKVEPCNEAVCLQLRNHDPSNKSFEIFMVNNEPVAGFQCDLPGVGISDANGGLLKENGFEASNSASRVLAFSMQGKIIPVGTGILTEISYSESTDEVCMTEIIFAGIGGTKLSNDIPECLKLN